jgi:iron-sulfur cluster assembly protein
MLTLTPAAAEVVRQLVANSPVDETGGVRISAGETTPEGTELQMQLVDQPETSDESVDEEGAHIYLEPTVAPYLEDKVLDAHLHEGGGAHFELRPQGMPGAEDNGRPEEA